MKKYNSLLFLLACFVLTACEEEISNIILEEESVVVVAYLYADQPIDSIRVTKSIAYSSEGELQTLDDLSLVINDGTEDITLENIGDGYYQNLDYIVQSETAYQLSFVYEGTTISAETYVQAPVTVELSMDTVELERIEFTGGFPGLGGESPEQVFIDISWDNSYSDYYFVVVENIETSSDYVNEIFEEILNDENSPQRFFRSEPDIMDVYAINSRRELQLYGTYKLIVYRLNTEYAALYETVGSSTLSIQEPPTNINNGLGIFTGVTPHYLYLEVVEK